MQAGPMSPISPKLTLSGPSRQYSLNIRPSMQRRIPGKFNLSMQRSSRQEMAVLQSNSMQSFQQCSRRFGSRNSIGSFPTQQQQRTFNSAMSSNLVYLPSLSFSAELAHISIRAISQPRFFNDFPKNVPQCRTFQQCSNPLSISVVAATSIRLDNLVDFPISFSQRNSAKILILAISQPRFLNVGMFQMTALP